MTSKRYQRERETKIGFQATPPLRDEELAQRANNLRRKTISEEKRFGEDRRGGGGMEARLPEVRNLTCQQCGVEREDVVPRRITGMKLGRLGGLAEPMADLCSNCATGVNTGKVDPVSELFPGCNVAVTGRVRTQVAGRPRPEDETMQDGYRKSLQTAARQVDAQTDVFWQARNLLRRGR